MVGLQALPLLRGLDAGFARLVHGHQLGLLRLGLAARGLYLFGHAQLEVFDQSVKLSALGLYRLYGPGSGFIGCAVLAALSCGVQGKLLHRHVVVTVEPGAHRRDVLLIPQAGYAACTPEDSVLLLAHGLGADAGLGEPLGPLLGSTLGALLSPLLAHQRIRRGDLTQAGSIVFALLQLFRQLSCANSQTGLGQTALEAVERLVLQVNDGHGVLHLALLNLAELLEAVRRVRLVQLAQHLLYVGTDRRQLADLVRRVVQAAEGVADLAQAALRVRPSQNTGGLVIAAEDLHHLGDAGVGLRQLAEALGAAQVLVLLAQDATDALVEPVTEVLGQAVQLALNLLQGCRV